MNSVVYVNKTNQIALMLLLKSINLLLSKTILRFQNLLTNNFNLKLFVQCFSKYFYALD